MLPTSHNAIPPGVTPLINCGIVERGVYVVDSNSRGNIKHRVDTEALECDCEGATKGIYWRLQHEHGKAWGNLCPHLKTALAAHGVICALAMKRNTNYGTEKH